MEYGADDWLGYELHKLYYLQSLVACTITESPSFLHRRLGHPSLNQLKRMLPHVSFVVHRV